ncbi:putative transposase [bacterium endosymbiont of Mortierella elongata FMR23-6]|nr:putative transposase [bacterium endosymbiont of Mortierella elongata FMR23-6]
MFSCQIDGKTGYIPLIFLAEHFSTAPEHIAFRFLQYTLSAMEDHLKAGHNKLPLILPICVYHGRPSPFPHSTDIYDEFEDAELARELVFKPFRLIDLTVLNEETIQHHGTAALMELLLKQAWVKDLLSTFRQLLESGILKQVLDQTTETYLLSVLNYAVNQGDENQPVEAFIQLLKKGLPERKEMIMTFAEQLEQRGRQQGLEQGRQEGMQQGMQQGRQEEARTIAQNLSAMGMDKAFIGKVTGLSDEDVTTLLKQTH